MAKRKVKVKKVKTKTLKGNEIKKVNKEFAQVAEPTTGWDDVSDVGIA